ncbi:hypothetical protein FRC17_010263 [Serendipita sp. 399]|nr:hypothetical protein FRC17_010263 [Serendipita sp. 399]
MSFCTVASNIDSQKISLSMLLAHIRAVDQRDAFEGFIFNSPAPSVASSTRSSVASSNILVVEDNEEELCRRLSALTASSIGSFTRRGSGSNNNDDNKKSATAVAKAERRKGCLIEGKRSLRQKIKQTLDTLAKRRRAPSQALAPPSYLRPPTRRLPFLAAGLTMKMKKKILKKNAASGPPRHW